MVDRKYSTEPKDAERFHEDFDRLYTRFAGAMIFL